MFTQLCSHTAQAIDKLPSIRDPIPPSTYKSEWIELPQGNIRFVKIENAEAKFTVVLMPDPPNTIEHMQALIDILQSTYSVLIFEGPGFGYSRASNHYDFSFAQNAELITHLLVDLEIENAILAFTCVAALAGLQVARERPDIVKGIVLGQTPPPEEARRWAKRVDFRGIMGTAFLGQLLLRMLRKPVAAIWYKNALPKGASSHFYQTGAVDSFRRGARFSLASGFQSLKNDRTPTEAFITEQKSVALWGMLDRTHKSTDKSSTLSMLPNGKLKCLENCGHFPDVEQPAIFAQAIDEVAAGI